MSEPKPKAIEQKYKFSAPLNVNEKPLDVSVKVTESQTVNQNFENSSKEGAIAPFTSHKNAQTKTEPEKPTTTSIGQDMWKQLKRVQIPVFSGEKRRYESWKAAFNACIDKAPATAEYKVLQLRQYLSGEALKCIENLGHSAVAYETAQERLERKFGGQRRQVAIYLEELDTF